MHPFSFCPCNTHTPKANAYTRIRTTRLDIDKTDRLVALRTRSNRDRCNAPIESGSQGHRVRMDDV